MNTKQVMAIVLDAVDNSVDGLDLDEASKLFTPKIGFPAFIYVVNMLAHSGLVTINSDHIAQRVKS